MTSKAPQELPEGITRPTPPAAPPAPPAVVSVPVDALRQVLQALVGPGYLIRELQATRAPEHMFPDNPINVLMAALKDNANGQKGLPSLDEALDALVEVTVCLGKALTAGEVSAMRAGLALSVAAELADRTGRSTDI